MRKYYSGNLRAVGTFKCAELEILGQTTRTTLNHVVAIPWGNYHTDLFNMAAWLFM